MIHNLKYYLLKSLGILILASLFSACSSNPENRYMVDKLKQIVRKSKNPDNPFANHLRVNYYDSLENEVTGPKNYQIQFLKGRALLRAGLFEKAAACFDSLQKQIASNKIKNFPGLSFDEQIDAKKALAFLLLGEQENCLHNHTAASCIFPIRAPGFHELTRGSEKAIEFYRKILQQDSSNLEAKWLLNIAYMTLGEHPQNVPEPFLIPAEQFNADYELPAFREVGAHKNIGVNDLSGGCIVEDFNNDGFLDIMASSWGFDDQLKLFISKGNGEYADKTKEASLEGMIRGLNMVQADYNNDGNVDVLVLRGAWLENNGKYPNSLLRNNGDGTFTDVTQKAGIFSLHPTQTATWNDFNNDGWVDLFIGNEAKGVFGEHSCEFYINNQDGTFTDIARTNHMEVNRYVKGVTSGDYNNDGWQDIYVSTLHGQNYLFKNQGTDKNGHPQFQDVTEKAGLAKPIGTFPTWFWDYNNDGLLDIFVCEFVFKPEQPSFAVNNVAADYLGRKNNGSKPRLFKNNGDGTFTEVSKQTNLDHVIYAMGSNFGDFDNDGWLDLYLGTGEPNLNAIMPNRAFRNAKGKTFQDVTSSSGLGHLQKGHAVAFADMDNDGDQDIYEVLGGAFEGDNYPNVLFENPHNELEDEKVNNWIILKLRGQKSNSYGVGSRIKIKVNRLNGNKATFYRDLNSGGSFGASPLRMHVGLGKVSSIDIIKVRWGGSNSVQKFQNIQPNQIIKIIEGNPNVKQESIQKITF